MMVQRYLMQYNQGTVASKSQYEYTSIGQTELAPALPAYSKIDSRVNTDSPHICSHAARGTIHHIVALSTRDLSQVVLLVAGPKLWDS